MKQKDELTITSRNIPYNLESGINSYVMSS